MRKKMKFFGAVIFGAIIMSTNVNAAFDDGTVINSVPVPAAQASAFMTSQKTTMDARVKQIRDEGREFGEGNWWQNNGKTIMNVAGAGIGGLLLGVGGAQIMKSTNKAAFNREQQEFMDNVGSKINCYIGGEEAGTFGDIISTEM